MSVGCWSSVIRHHRSCAVGRSFRESTIISVTPRVRAGQNNTRQMQLIHGKSVMMAHFINWNETSVPLIFYLPCMCESHGTFWPKPRELHRTRNLGLATLSRARANLDSIVKSSLAKGTADTRRDGITHRTIRKAGELRTRTSRPVDSVRDASLLLKQIATSCLNEGGRVRSA